jgi:3-hydroxyisobutyrate dehydrogenase-like beta-hydroxyacid dehydrogenase
MQYAHRKAAMMLEGEFPVAFALKLARKDAQLASRRRPQRASS